VLVVFRKAKRGLCAWEAHPPKRRPVAAIGGPGGHGLPHDLLQLLVERELGHRHGFWGCLADGASFRSLVWGGRRRTPQGRAVIASHLTELDAAERDANAEAQAWRHGVATAMTPVLVEMRERWLALPEGGEIELDFPLTRPAPVRLPVDASRPRSRPAAGGR
jgi:hypothetical protein